MVAMRLLVALALLPALVAAIVIADAPSKAQLKAKDVSTPVLKRLRAGQAVDKVLVAHTTKTRRQMNSMRMGTPEQLEDWVDSGAGVTSSLSEADIATMNAGITKDTFLAQLHAVVDPDPSRMVAFKGNVLAAEHIEKEFKDMGLTTEVQSLGAPLVLAQYMNGASSVAGNVMGYMKGTDMSNEVVIVACHYDSVNWDSISSAAPGVDDNGSGVALMLMLAKAFTASANKPRRSLLFVAFQAEEEGLVGSKKFAEMFGAGGSGLTKFGKPVGAIVADEIAWPGKSSSQRKVIFETKGKGHDTNVVVDTLAHAAKAECPGDCASQGIVNGFVANYHGFGSDHISMLDVGIPAVLLIERDNMYHADTWGHTAQDTFAHVDGTFGASTTRIALSAVARLATPAEQHREAVAR